ncbi:transglutaminase domain-containing protein [Streptomyces sp. NPDC046862]|uniref:transglutaminase domain-containing protein n=1 Tax=Streptomyces sp. NPDC046862 TaxID=3154603 RepID=UPI00345220B4
MTSRLLMPCRTASVARLGRPQHAEPADAAAAVEGSTLPTRILDWRHPRVTGLTSRVQQTRPASPLDALRTAHGIIAREVRPVYSVDDRRRASRTLALGRGSCSQRMAVLEAVARASGVATRVRGLLVDGSFWYPRFPRLKTLVPERVLLAWPEFGVDGGWVPIGELFSDMRTGAASAGFTNKGGETLFDAVARTGLRWDGPLSCGAQGDSCDLSARVRVDLGHFDDRDSLFERHGPTLCLPARTLGEPVLGRWSAGAQAASGPRRP